MKFIAAAQAHAKPNRIDLTDNRELGYGTWHLEKTNLLQGVCLYTLISLSLSLCLSSRSTVSADSYFDCFTSRSLWPWLLKGKTKAHNLFLQTAIHCACVSGCPSGQYCLDAQLKCESRGQDTTGQDEAWISTQLTEITQTNLLGFPGAKRNPVEDQHTTHLESERGHSHCDKDYFDTLKIRQN